MMKTLLFGLFFLNFFCTSGQVDSLINVYNKTESDTERVNMLNKITFGYERINLDSSDVWAKKLLKFTKTINFKRGLGYYNNHIGRIFLYSQQYDSAIFYFNKSIIYFKGDNFVKGIISANNNIATCYAEMGELDESLKYNFLNVETAKAYKNEVAEADGYVNIANVYNRKRNTNLSIKYALLSLKLYEKLKIDDKLGYCYFSLGSSNYDLKNYFDAIKFCNLSLNYFKKVKLESQATRNYVVMVNIYNETKKFNQALKVSREGIALSQKYPNINILCYFYNSLSQTYLGLNSIDSSLFYAQKGVKLSNEINTTSLKMNSYYQLARCFEIKKDYREAQSHLDTSLFYALKVGDLNSQHNIYKSLANCNIAIGNKEKAIQYLNLKYAMLDSVYNINNFNSINEQRIIYDTEKKEKELLKSESNLKLAESESSRKSIVLTVSTIALTVSILLALIALINYRNAKKASKLVSHQKEVLEEKQNEILSSIRYAKRIQQSLMPTEKYIDRVIKNKQ